jgi:hypothetical protein
VLPKPPYRVFLGFDAKEMRTCNVAKWSIHASANRSEVGVEILCRMSLLKHYTRPTSTMRNGQLFDKISDAPMSTGHAIARFFVPFLCDYRGWALFVDGDVLVRRDIRELFALADPTKAVQVVQHPPQTEESVKKLGHVQQAYPCKNWSSAMLFNCAHPANARLSLDTLNNWPGRDLHAFRWLDDPTLIGALPAEWNYLVGVSAPQSDPAIVHYTLGTPDMPGHDDDPFADEWFAAASVAGYRMTRKSMGAGV